MPPKTFAIVTAVYNVARYLPDFIASIEAQDFDLSLVEVVAVDDGSSDESLLVLQEWAARRPELVTVLSQPNAGQGSARNRGVQHVSATWVTYTDPDDMIEPDYLSKVAQFIERHPDVPMVATNRIVWNESSGETRKHPLAAMFKRGDQLVDLNRYPDYFHGSAPAAFLRTQVIRDHDLRYDERVQPNFEDGHFCVRYLFLTRAEIGFVGTARYVYRKRADQSSTLQRSLEDARKFTDVPRHGYLDVLTTARQVYGRVPEWLQTFIVYELSFYFTAEMAQSASQTAATGDVARQFLATAREIRSLLDDHVIENFAVRRLPSLLSSYLLHGLAGRNWTSDHVVLDDYDQRLQLVRATYRYVGARPAEIFLRRGTPVAPTASKTRNVTLFEEVAVVERIAWLRADGTFEVRLNGVPLRLTSEWPGTPVTRLRPTALRELAGRGEVSELQGSAPASKDSGASRARRAAALLTRSPLTRARYKEAWVLMDRVHDADDSGERLFRYLRDNRPTINAWFVLEKGVPDWDRLAADGYGSRLIAYGGGAWRSVLMNAKHLISSHIDKPVHNPPGMAGLPHDWTFTFLQHGVIKDDLSNWLNSKRLDLFVTSTPAEHASIVEDGSPYVFTDHEVKLTGLPRFDRQRALGEEIAPDARDLLLVAPTWRHWLTGPLEPGSQRRAARSDFLETQYAQQWLGLLRSPRLAQLCRDERLTLGFLPHPNLQSILETLQLPTHVKALTFHGQDVQRLFARSALMVTDYSSMVFNAAYIERPVVYFQFDQERMFGGSHVGRAGYFSYERDGFGPVVNSVDAAVEATVDALAAGRRAPADEYLARINATFPLRDGRCCERVTAAIEAL